VLTGNCVAPAGKSPWVTSFALGVKAALLAEQRARIAFKDKACNYYADGDCGAEGKAVDWARCRAGVISDRIGAIDAIETGRIGE
jgi:uncharacterized protein YecT (DUF1311 family)